MLPEALLKDPAFAQALRPVLPDFRAKEFSLYLIYPGRKFVPFKSRAFIDLVLGSAPKSQEPKPAGLPAQRRRYMGAEQAQAVAV
jgi:DNA-binding transcriptional LysR family regulator